MEMVQWIFENDGQLRSVLVPKKTHRLGFSSPSDMVRAYDRRQVLESKHLPFALAYGEPVGTPEESALGPPMVNLRFVLAGGEGPEAAPLHSAQTPAVSLASLAEFYQVVSDLFEEARLPLASITPKPKETAFDVLVPVSNRIGAQRLANVLTLLRTAIEIIAQSRGFSMVSSGLVTQVGGQRELRADLVRYFLDITQ